MDKKALLEEIFHLGNGPRNFRVWLALRAKEHADHFKNFGARKELIRRFMDVGEGKLPQWIDKITDIYSRRLTDEEVRTLYQELTKQREVYGFDRDIPDDVLSKESIAVFEKIANLQHELDEVMHSMLPTIILATIAIHVSRN